MTKCITGLGVTTDGPHVGFWLASSSIRAAGSGCFWVQRLLTAWTFSFLAFIQGGSAYGLPDSAHVEMGDLHDFGEAIHTGGVSRVQLLLGNGTQGPHKLHNGLAVQLVTATPHKKCHSHAEMYCKCDKIC